MDEDMRMLIIIGLIFLLWLSINKPKTVTIQKTEDGYIIVEK